MHVQITFIHDEFPIDDIYLRPIAQRLGLIDGQILAQKLGGKQLSADRWESVFQLFTFISFHIVFGSSPFAARSPRTCVTQTWQFAAIMFQSRPCVTRVQPVLMVSTPIPEELLRRRKS